MFDTTKEDLRDLLSHAGDGRLQLPDFQRDYVWGDEDVRGLLASIAQGFPVGALLTLETGGPVSFKPRPIEGTGIKGPERTSPAPDTLLLDGQQRITSLFQALWSREPIKTTKSGGKIVERHYYLDMRKALTEGVDMTEAIEGVPADRVRRTDFGRQVDLDLSTPQGEYANHMYPLDKLFDHSENRDWWFEWRGVWPAERELERAFETEVLDRIRRYKMPVIRLDKANTREAICVVFEKVNVGGKKLDAFELVTAIFAGNGFDLRDDWKKRSEAIAGTDARRDVLTRIASVDFLQAVTFQHTYARRRQRESEGVSQSELPPATIRRDALLALPYSAYLVHADDVEEGFRQAAIFLNEQKIIWAKDVPYPPQIVALAAFFAARKTAQLGDTGRKRLKSWFWSAALGERYGTSAESRVATDVRELLDWIDGTGVKPQAVREATFRKDRLDTLRNRNSAAYKAIHALLMREGCEDFITGQSVELSSFVEAEIDIHHIFPAAWCKRQGIAPDRRDSIVNKTALSATSNRVIGGSMPSTYLSRIEQEHETDPARLDAILRSHRVEPKDLRADNFEAFYTARREALAGLIRSVLDNPVVPHDAARDEPEHAVPIEAEEGEAA